MPNSAYKRIRLEDRGIIRLSGPDARNLLQGIVTVDINALSPSKALYGALLTPQGKYLFDFFLIEHDGDILIDAEAARLDELVKRLMMYRLRADVDITDESETLTAVALPGDGAADALGLPGEKGAAKSVDGGAVYIDPRTRAIGVRAVVAPEAVSRLGGDEATQEDYERRRIALGLPASGRDLRIDKSYLLECNLDHLNAVDFSKGCYIGQELTARMKHRGNLRKRLYPVRIEGKAAPESEIEQDGKTVGTLFSVADGNGIALLRIEAVEKRRESDDHALSAGPAELTPFSPPWADF